MSLYQVVGRRSYRRHKPGDTFEAVLDARAEARAVGRGAIRLVRRGNPSLPETYAFPAGWLTHTQKREVR